MLLAHLGTDHILVFLIPVVLAILAMRLVEKRAKARAEESGAPEESPPS